MKYIDLDLLTEKPFEWVWRLIIISNTSYGNSELVHLMELLNQPCHAGQEGCLDKITYSSGQPCWTFSEGEFVACKKVLFYSWDVCLMWEIFNSTYIVFANIFYPLLFLWNFHTGRLLVPPCRTKVFNVGILDSCGCKYYSSKCHASGGCWIICDEWKTRGNFL